MGGVTFGRAQPMFAGGDVMAEGLGGTKPATFAVSPHHTMIVMKVTWSEWGGPIARGVGVAENAAHADGALANSPIEKAYVSAKLGQCHGKPAYTKVRWNFTSFAENESSTDGWSDICDLASN